MRDDFLNDINLASEPFRQERAQNAVWALLCAALALTLLICTVSILHARGKAADLRQQIDSEQAQLNRLTGESNGFSAVLNKPDNADVFARNVFLNELIARRSVSWTLLFRDLEQLLPKNTRLVGVRLPQVSGASSRASAAQGVNRVQLDMVVGMDRPDTIVELLSRLSHSSLFGTAKVLGQTPPNQNDPLYKFRVTVPYAQKL